MGTDCIRTLLVCFSLLAPLSAQQPQPNLFRLEGTVINSVTGKPLPRVLVLVNGRSALSGAEGEFSFDGVPAGRVYIQTTKPGYFHPGGGTPRNWSPGVSMDVGPDSGKVVVKLAPEAVISGRVTGQDEEPLEGVGIQALTFISIEGRKILTPMRPEVRTDEDGNFRIASLPSGHYYLELKAAYVTRSILGAQTPKRPETYPPVVFYPGSSDLSGATALDIAPGQSVEAQFSLALTPAFKLAGRIVVAPGNWKQVDSPVIIDGLEQVLFTTDRFDSSSGSFEFRALPAGTYNVRVSGSDSEDHHRFSIQQITVSRSIEDARLLLRPGADIPVAVRTEFNKPPQRGSCAWGGGKNGESKTSDCSDYPAARVELLSMDSQSMRSRFATDYQPMKDPSAFALHGVAAGKYVIRAQPTLGGYVQSVRSGNLDLLRETLTVPEEGAVAPIEVVLRDDPGTLKVTLHADKPGQAATIVVFLSGALSPPSSATVIAGEDYYFPPLAPGEYKVLAFDSLDGLDLGNADVLARYASKAAPVTITANGNASVTVDMIHVGD